MNRFETTTVDPARRHDLPSYPEDFGHLAESIIQDAIAQKAGVLIEQVERGTANEDIRRKVDFWIQVKDIPEPIGIQFTCSKDQDNVQNKKDYLRDVMHNTARKDSRPDSIIKWNKPARVILVQGNRDKIVKAWEEGQKTGQSPAFFIGDELIRDILSQVTIEMGRIDPIRVGFLRRLFESAALEKKRLEQKKKRMARREN